MDHVEALLLHDRGHAVGEVKAQRDACDGIVDRNRDRASDPVEAGGVEVDVGPARRREDPGLMVELAQAPSQVAHVVVDAAGRSEVVGRDKPYPHALTSPDMAIAPRGRIQSCPHPEIHIPDATEASPGEGGPWADPDPAGLFHGEPCQMRCGTCHCSGWRRMKPSMCLSSSSVARTWSALGSPVSLAKTSGAPSAWYESSGSRYA